MPFESALQFEQQVLQIMLDFEESINAGIPHYPALMLAPAPAPNPWRNTAYLDLIYYFLLIVGLLEDAANRYLFGYTLFSLMPGIVGPYITLCAIIYTLLDCILFYAFEVTFLKEALGIPYMSHDTSLLLDIQIKQIECMKRVDRVLHLGIGVIKPLFQMLKR